MSASVSDLPSWALPQPGTVVSGNIPLMAIHCQPEHSARPDPSQIASPRTSPPLHGHRPAWIAEIAIRSTVPEFQSINIRP